MGENSNFLEILFFALIAGFLFFRLRSVLGRRHGDERQRVNPFVTECFRSSFPERVQSDEPHEAVSEPFSLAAGISQIKSADTGFDERQFARGVKAAFEMIVNAYAQGDLAALRPLLSDTVYKSFSEEIRRRQSSAQVHETHIERIKDVDLLDARMEGLLSIITVKIISDQVNVTRSETGLVLDGDPDRLVELTDIWTFTRNIKSRDPNWQLVETKTSN